MSDEKHVSSAAHALLAKKRSAFEYDVSSIFGLEDGKMQVRIRVPTKREQDIAFVGAHAYVARAVEKTPVAKDDPDILDTSKAAYIVALACRDNDEPERLPAFATGEWVQETMTADQIGPLLALVNRTRAKESGDPIEITQVQIDAALEFVVSNAGTDTAEIGLTKFTHHYLVVLHMATAAALHEAREKLLTVTAKLRDAEEQLAVAQSTAAVG